MLVVLVYFSYCNKAPIISTNCNVIKDVYSNCCKLTTNVIPVYFSGSDCTYRSNCGTHTDGKCSGIFNLFTCYRSDGPKVNGLNPTYESSLKFNRYIG